MNFWQALVIATVPTVGVVLTVMHSTRDLAMRRRLEITDRFFQIVATAQGKPDPDANHQVAEQIASIHLLAEFGLIENYLRIPALGSLGEIEDRANDPKLGYPDGVREACNGAISRLEGYVNARGDYAGPIEVNRFRRLLARARG